MLKASNDYTQINGFAVSMAIVDDGGGLLGSLVEMDMHPFQTMLHKKRQDRQHLGRRESKLDEDMINGGRHGYLSVPMLNGLLGEESILLTMDIRLAQLECLELNQIKMQELQ